MIYINTLVGELKMNSTIEGSVLIVGYFLGGPVGIGTLIIAFTLGLSIQWAFKIGGYSSESVQHVSLMDLYRDFRTQKDTELDINSRINRD